MGHEQHQPRPRCPLRNGGWAGTISYPAMAGAGSRLRDDIHRYRPSTAGGSFALGHCEKLIDYAYRPEHEMTVKAKAIIKAFYGSADAIGIEPEA